MKEFVDKVLKAEKETEGLVGEARVKAAGERFVGSGSRADAEVADRIRQAKQQAQELIRRGVDEARARVNEEHRRETEQAHRTSESYFTQNADRLDRIVDAVTRLIVEPGYRK